MHLIFIITLLFSSYIFCTCFIHRLFIYYYRCILILLSSYSYHIFHLIFVLLFIFFSFYLPSYSWPLECGATFINIKAGSLMDKWFGEADKLVAGLFRYNSIAIQRPISPPPLLFSSCFYSSIFTSFSLFFPFFFIVIIIVINFLFLLLLLLIIIIICYVPPLICPYTRTLIFVFLPYYRIVWPVN